MKPSRVLCLAACLAGVFQMPLALANSTAQTLPFGQDWSDAGLIAADDNWDGVPGIVGYRGDDITATTGVDPQTLIGEGTVTVDVLANQTAPNTLSTGGVAEFALSNPTIALNGSGTADAPNIVISLDTTGQSNIVVAYTLRDLDGSADNAVQPVALQYRVGTSGSFTNVAAGFVADASGGPSLASLETGVSATLPAAAEGQALVQVRIITANAAGNDEWVGIDDLSITAGGTPTAPSVILDVDPESISEAGGVATVSATLSAVSTQDVGVGLLFSGSATDGTASGGPDYSASAASLVIPAGDRSASITLTANDDTGFEGDETIVVTLGSLTHATAGTPGSVSTTIVENDPMPEPTFGARIYEIQGAAHRSPLFGTAVTQVPGIVTARAPNGFYMQDGDGDGDDATSDGLFVFTSSAPASGVVAGAQVLVDGTVDEFRPGGAASNLTITEIVSPSVTLSSGLFTKGAITPTVLGTAGRIPPDRVIDDDSAGNLETSATTVFDPAQDGIDFYESLEGMLVQVDGGRVTGPRNSFGEIWVLGDLGANATGGNARGGITLVESDGGIDFNPERIQLDDGLGTATPAVSVGDTLTNIRGVMHYDFGNFEVRLTQAPVVTSNPLPAGVRTLEFGGDRLTVAAYNVENLDPGDTSFERLAGQIVDRIGSPDILALSEVQDNNGATNNGLVAADVTLGQLIAAISAAGGPAYAYTQIDPANNQDGGEPGGNIRVVQLYNEARVTFVPGTVGAGGSADATAPTQVDGKVALTLSPGRIAPTSSAWSSSRKPLAATYDFNGRRVVVINNHFNSKGGDQPLFGVNQPPLLSSGVQRGNQAGLVHDFVASVLDLDPEARVVVLGDLNDFDFSPPLRILRKGPLGADGEDGTEPVLVNLGTELVTDPVERYSYVFEGNSQELDHILCTASLFNAAAQYEALHINAEYSDQASDHDALLASFLLPANVPPTADAGSDKTVAGGDPVSLDGSASADSDGRIDRYVWTQASGTPVALTGDDTATPAFAAPAAAGTLRFTLAVTDDQGATETDDVEITVAADITPNAFTFVDAGSAARDTLQTSNGITVAGINTASPVAVEGGFFGINGGPCTLTSGSAVSGDVLRVCHTSSGAYSTDTHTTLTIGADGVLLGVSDTFTSTTLAEQLPAVEFRLASESLSESVGTRPVELLLDRASTQEVQVAIAYAGSARFGIDYTAPGQVTIPAGVSSYFFDVRVIDDSRDEPARSIEMQLGEPEGATLGNPAQRRLTIYDNDPAPTVRFDKGSSSVNESAGTRNLLIKLSAASDNPVTIPLQYSGSARRNSDYRAPDSVRIASGATSVSVPVQILNDGVREGAEKIVIEIGAPQNAGKGSPGKHTVSIAGSD